VDVNKIIAKVQQKLAEKKLVADKVEKPKSKEEAVSLGKTLGNMKDALEWNEDAKQNIEIKHRGKLIALIPQKFADNFLKEYGEGYL